MKKTYRGALIIAVLLITVLINLFFFHTSKSMEVAGAEANANQTVPAAKSLESFILKGNQCYYSIKENDELKYYTAEYKDKTILNPTSTNKPKDETKVLSKQVTLNNPFYVNGYEKGYIALKPEDGAQESVAYFKEDDSQHLDLFSITKTAKEKLDFLYATPDFRYFFYTRKLDGITQLLAFDLAQNQKKEFSESGQFYAVEQIKGSLSIFQVSLPEGFDTPVLTPLEQDKWFYADQSKNVKKDGYDTVIQNGIVVDPETDTMKFGYNVGIINDKISVITKQALTGKQVVNATGQIVSPGFIDMLSFNVNATGAKYKITDGVTTNLAMHGCTVNFGGFFSSNEKNPPMVNYGGALFAVLLRRELGIGDYSKPTQQQIDIMVKRAREEIKKGAIAVAFSPEYYPGTSPEEIKAIMKVAKEFNIPTHFHGRYSSITGEHTSIDTVKEVLGYAKELNAPVHFMHLHSTGGTGCMDEALKLISDAQAKGYKVTYDIYPYDSWASRFDMARFQGDWQKRFGISYKDLQVAGRPGRLTSNTFAQYKPTHTLCIAYAMNEDEVIAALKKSDVMIGSDDDITVETNPNSHPRGAGTFSRVIGRYSRDLDAFSLVDALKKMTSNSAKHLEAFTPAMKVRGRMREGFIADITVFDYFKINDRSTAVAPATTSTGISFVAVSGKTVLDGKGLHTSVRSGKPIKGVFAN